MEKYRSKIKMQCVLLVIALAALLAVQILAWLRVVQPVVGDTQWAERWNGFIAGLAASLTFFCVVALVMDLWALHDEKKLKKQFVQVNDERVIRLTQEAQSAGARIFLFLQLVAVVVCGYFSVTVALTCLVCLFAQALLLVGCKLYWWLKK